MTAGAVAPRLSEEQLREILGLLRGADSAELKLTVADAQRAEVVDALGIDPLDAQMRQVFFLDTPDLALDRAGVVLRARRIQGAEADSVVKLRPVVPDQLSEDVRQDPSFGVEVDAMPGGFVCSASFKGTSTNDDVRRITAGGGPLRKLFSKPQRAFFRAHAPEGIEIDDLTVLGPITLLKVKVVPDGLGRKLVAELWFYPDGSRVLELSTKCRPDEAFQVAVEARAFLSERGVDLAAPQTTKTRTALKYFSSQLGGSASDDA